jgi:3-hydroxybutyryl-CoA dehydrogenase
MGRGITLAVASCDIPVILYDLHPETVSQAASLIEKELEQGVSKKRISAEDKENILRRISFSTSISDCRAPLIIEAIIEKTEAKSILFL